MMSSRCLMCGRPFETKTPRRICCRCHRPIARHHKFTHDNSDGSSRLCHRNCEDPENYESAPRPPASLEADGVEANGAAPEMAAGNS